MEALILSCGTGGGHNTAGMAIMEELERRGHHAVMINPYTLQGVALARRIDEAYIVTARRTPKAFGTLYNAGELYRKLPFRSPVYFANRGMVSVMERYLAEHSFDIVIMPHLFPAEILTNMKRLGMEVPKTMFVATDYCCIPFTEETDCDAYVIPAPELTDDFAGRGIPEERIYPYGIPVHRSFAEGESQGKVGCREKVKSQLGLAVDKKYILIAGGSIGAGQIEKLIGLLLEHKEGNEETELIVVCGNNRKLYEKLDKRYGRQIIMIGHTDQMAEYVRASDLYITKPGGLSSTEAAVSGVPLLHMPPIPGCETYNARYFLEHGMSRTCEITEQGAAAVFELLHQEEVLAALVHGQHMYMQGDAANRICDLAEEFAQGLVGSYNKVHNRPVFYPG